MYGGVDIGGTKTIVAVIDSCGEIVEKFRFLTPASYDEFLDQLREAIRSLHTKDFRAASVAVPGRVNRKHGIGEAFGNLPWHHVPIGPDVEQIFNCPVSIENDANLGGLSESMLLPKDRRVLYVTISTGIGTGFIYKQSISPDLADSEGGHMLIEHHGRRVAWEDFASGQAIVKRFGKRAEDITDTATWHRIAHDLALGFIELIAIAQPDIIVIGGGVGHYFEHFRSFLLDDLKRYASPLVTMPTIQEAKRPDDAVLYGCYELARQHHGTTT